MTSIMKDPTMKTIFFSALMSLGLMLDGILYLLPNHDTPCYQYKLIYGLFIVPIITGFFSVLGMAIERFQVFALYRDRRRLTRKFSIAWFMASWTLGQQSLCFLFYLQFLAIFFLHTVSLKFFFHVDHPQESIFFDHHLWFIFQSSIHNSGSCIVVLYLCSAIHYRHVHDMSS